MRDVFDAISKSLQICLLRQLFSFLCSSVFPKKISFHFQGHKCHLPTSFDCKCVTMHGRWPYISTCTAFSLLTRITFTDGHRRSSKRIRDMIRIAGPSISERGKTEAGSASSETSGEKLTHQVFPAPSLPPSITVLREDQLQLRNMLAKSLEMLEPIYSIWKLVSAFIAAELSPN